jgi:hypothetical protein
LNTWIRIRDTGSNSNLLPAVCRVTALPLTAYYVPVIGVAWNLSAYYVQFVSTSFGLLRAFHSRPTTCQLPQWNEDLDCLLRAVLILYPPCHCLLRAVACVTLRPSTCPQKQRTTRNQMDSSYLWKQTTLLTRLLRARGGYHAGLCLLRAEVRAPCWPTTCQWTKTLC